MVPGSCNPVLMWEILWSRVGGNCQHDVRDQNAHEGAAGDDAAQQVHLDVFGRFWFAAPLFKLAVRSGRSPLPQLTRMARAAGPDFTLL